MNKKSVVISVTNDLVTDQRVKRTIEVLSELNYDITLIGRVLPNSLPIEVSYRTVRFNLWFRRGFLFYANYNIRLFLFLLFSRYDLYFSNDLDTLLPNHLASKIKNKPLVYDSHEYFLGVPEIQHRPIVKGVWRLVEKHCLPKVDGFITVNESIKKLYLRDYGKEAAVVRNISNAVLPDNIKSRKELNLPENKFIFINQGSGINVDRGMEEFMNVLPQLENAILLLVGKGDVYPLLKERADKMGISNQVIFIPPQPYQEMLQYTLNADCGLSLDKGTNANYEFSLPNKLFDYIKCGIPVLASNVIEVKSIVEKYGIGEIIVNHELDTIKEAANRLTANGKEHYQNGILKASKENNWQEERAVLLELIQAIEHK